MTRIRITKQQGREWARRPPSVKPSQYVKHATIKAGDRFVQLARESGEGQRDNLKDQARSVREGVEAAGGTIEKVVTHVGRTYGRDWYDKVRQVTRFARKHNCKVIVETADRVCRNFDYGIRGRGEDAVSDKDAKARMPGVPEFTNLMEAADGVPIYTLHPPELSSDKVRSVQTKRSGKAGRPRKIKYNTGEKDTKLPVILKLYEQGVSKKEISRRTGVKRPTVIRWIQQEGY